MKKYNISGCHSRVLEKFSISSNHSSDKPHWLQYCHCAKLQQISELTYLILFESFDGMLIRLASFDSSQVFDTLMLLKWAYYHVPCPFSYMHNETLEWKISVQEQSFDPNEKPCCTQGCVNASFGLCKLKPCFQRGPLKITSDSWRLFSRFAT